MRCLPSSIKVVDWRVWGIANRRNFPMPIERVSRENLTDLDAGQWEKVASTRPMHAQNLYQLSHCPSVLFATSLKSFIVICLFPFPLRYCLLPCLRLRIFLVGREFSHRSHFILMESRNELKREEKGTRTMHLHLWNYHRSGGISHILPKTERQKGITWRRETIWAFHCVYLQPLCDHTAPRKLNSAHSCEDSLTEGEAIRHRAKVLLHITKQLIGWWSKGTRGMFHVFA